MTIQENNNLSPRFALCIFGTEYANSIAQRQGTSILRQRAQNIAAIALNLFQGIANFFIQFVNLVASKFERQQPAQVPFQEDVPLVPIIEEPAPESEPAPVVVVVAEQPVPVDQPAPSPQNQSRNFVFQLLKNIEKEMLERLPENIPAPESEPIAINGLATQEFDDATLEAVVAMIEQADRAADEPAPQSEPALVAAPVVVEEAEELAPDNEPSIQQLMASLKKCIPILLAAKDHQDRFKEVAEAAAREGARRQEEPVLKAPLPEIKREGAPQSEPVARNAVPQNGDNSDLYYYGPDKSGVQDSWTTDVAYKQAPQSDITRKVAIIAGLGISMGTATFLALSQQAIVSTINFYAEQLST